MLRIFIWLFALLDALHLLHGLPPHLLCLLVHHRCRAARVFEAGSVLEAHLYSLLVLLEQWLGCSNPFLVIFINDEGTDYSFSAVTETIFDFLQMVFFLYCEDPFIILN